jgi:hypothetical protein
MRLFIYLLFATLAVAACNPGEKRISTVSTETDALQNPAAPADNNGNNNGNNNPGNTGNDTTSPSTDTVPSGQPAESMADKALLGRHNLTLQWIGWNIPGLAIIEKGKDGWYTIKGKQENNRGYLIIDGKLRPVFENVEDAVTELEFDGRIEYREDSLNAGQVCTKKGTQMFLSTQGRKYWRLQNMMNCDGTTTDYIDIYFK